MIQIGITGGIGSGKSTVCRVFATLGIPVLDADILAKNIIRDDVELKNNIINHFGVDAYFQDGTYNKNYIANIVFNNVDALLKLNELVHPKVIEHSISWAKQQHTAPYIVKEAALMFESGSYIHNNFNIVVEAPIALRIDRICIRNNITREEAMLKIESQWSDEKRREKADLILINNEQTSIIKQVMNIHNNIISNNDPR